MIAMDFSPKFPLGRIFITANAAREVHPDDVRMALRRHARGDWGDLDDYSRQQNQRALKKGSTIASRYHGSNGVLFWVITEADRRVTTVLLPLDY